MSFWSSGHQESNALNSVQIKAEIKKLWPLEDNHAKLKGNFASCENHKVQVAKSTFSCEMETFRLWNFCNPCCKLLNPPECSQIAAKSKAISFVIFFTQGYLGSLFSETNFCIVLKKAIHRALLCLTYSIWLYFSLLAKQALRMFSQRMGC